MGFKDKMKDAAAQAAVQARKGAEQAKDLAVPQQPPLPRIRTRQPTR